MFVYPQGKIVFLRGVPLDTSYEHTIYFSTKLDQEEYFTSKIKPDTINAGRVIHFYLTDQSYTRVGDNLQVDIPADELYDCNYIMFQNLAFGTKWFYAFLKTVRYVNNRVSSVAYEIDPIQTWFFDYELGMTFVEREHASSDNFFENIVPENLDAGSELVATEKFDNFIYAHDELSLVTLYAGLDSQGIVGQPNLLNNHYYMPCYYKVAQSNDQGATVMTSFLLTSGNVQDPNDVIACYQAPGRYFPADSENPERVVDRELDFYMSMTSTGPQIPNRLELDGYVPRNKKLYISPYNQVVVSNNVGGAAVYKFENGNNHAVELRRTSNSIPTPVAFVYPKNYRNLEHDYESGLALYNFPVCGWVTDTYKAWWAQNEHRIKAERAEILTKGIANAWNSVGPVSTQSTTEEYGSGQMSTGPVRSSAPVGITAVSKLATSLIDTGNKVNQTLAKQQDIEALPNAAGGQFKCDVLNLAKERVGFTIYRMTIKHEYAIIIDDYFTKYGYACKRVKNPNRKSRRYWTYVKTIGCVITPLSNKGLPCDDEAKICAIYDKGITFWRFWHGETLEVGNYNLDNYPTGQEGG